MADIYQSGFGIDTEDYPFHGSHVSIGCAEIGSEGNYGTHIAIYPALTHPQGYYGKDNKYDNQRNGKLEKRFFHTPLGTKNRVSLSEDAAQTAAAHLKQGYPN
jgi:hypothetical protein